MGEGGVLPHTGGFAPQHPGAVDGGGGDSVAGGLVHGDAFAGQGALIHGGFAGQHDAVHGDAAAGSDDEDIPLANLIDGNLHLLLLTDHQSGLGRQLHQAPQSIGGFALGAGFQHFSHGDQGEDHGGGLKVKFVHQAVSLSHHSLGLQMAHIEQGSGAVDECSTGTKGHQGIHVGTAVEQPLETADEELLVDDHDDAGEQKLNQSEGHGIFLQHTGQGKPPHMPHGHIHQHGEESNGCDEPVLQRRGLAVLQGIFACVRARCGCPRHLCAVTGVLHGIDDLLGRDGALHRHGVGQQTDGAAFHTGQGADGFFYPGRASSAAHAGDLVFGHRHTSFGHFISLYRVSIRSSMTSSLP